MILYIIGFILVELYVIKKISENEMSNRIHIVNDRVNVFD
jgi:hypothetical protein